MWGFDNARMCGLNAKHLNIERKALNNRTVEHLNIEREALNN